MSERSQGPFLYRFGNCELDELGGELRCEGTPADIEPRCRALLLCLLRQAGTLVTKDQLLDEVWGGRHYGDKVIGNAMARVRKAIGDVDGKIIRNERNRGYILSTRVEKLPAQATPEFRPETGARIPGRGSWRLIEKLGSGGAGEVWLCEDEARQQRVFKFSLGPDQDAALKREVTLSRVLSGSLSEDKKQNYVQVLEWNIEVHPYYIEFEFAGLSLRAWAERKGGLDAIALPQRIALMERIACAVGDAHSVGVLHKDLKPDNVLIDERDRYVHVRLTDFGAGHLLERERANHLQITVRGWTRAQTDSTSGTLLWMAPELFEGSGATLQSDLYSLGVMLYQIALGDFGRILAPDWHPDIDDEVLREDIDAVTKRNPECRLADAHELARRLRTLDARRHERHLRKLADARAAEAEEMVRRSRARRPYLVASVAALALGLVASTYFYFQQVARTREARSMGEFVNQDLLAAAQPQYGGSPTITLKDAMVKSLDLARKRFANDPAFERQVLVSFADTFSYLGEFRANYNANVRLAELDSLLSGADSSAVLEDKLAAVNAQVMMGQFAEAEKSLHTLEDRIEANKSDVGVVSQYLQLRLSMAYQTSDYDQAAVAGRKLVDLYEEPRSQKIVSGDALAIAIIQLGGALVMAGRPTEVLSLYDSHLPKVRAGADNVLPLIAEAQLAAAQRDLGQIDKALEGFERVCATMEQKLGATEKETLNCRRDEAFAYERNGAWERAANLLEAVDSGYRKDPECVNESVCVFTGADVAFALANGGQPARSLEKARAVLQEAHSSKSLDPTMLPYSLYALAQAAISTNDLELATATTKELSDAIARPQTQGPEWTGRQKLLQGEILLKSGRHTDGVAMVQDARSAFSKKSALSGIDDLIASRL